MDHHLLVSELQALVVEAKRRHPDVKDAGEKGLEILRGGQVSRGTLLHNADAMLSPVTLGCKTETPKIIGIAITVLQRLVAAGGVPTPSLPSVLQTLNSVSNQGVDIQLKILQALLSVLTYNPDAHGEILGNALLLCFKLQDVRVSVVSSTAAATLRQAVMLIFDRLSNDQAPDEEGKMLQLPTQPPTEVTVSPAVMDAYCVLSDLCLLTARSGGSGLLSWGGGDKEKPKLLTLSNLQRTFGLELIESILSGYEEPVKQRPELVHLLSHSLDALLLKLLAEKPTFPIALRVCRLIFLLIRSFSAQLPGQVEVYLNTLIKLGMGEGEDESKKEVVQPWFRVLALEIIRGICGDNKLLQNLFEQYDRQGESKLFSKLVTSLSRLMSEKPNLLGVSDQMHGLGVPTGEGTGPNAGYLDIGFGMVASAANVGVNTVSSMMGSQGGGLGPQSGLKLKLIEQHDKAEAPLIPETYIYLLALQSLNAVASGIHSAARTPSEILSGMAESAWPALLAALSFTMATNLSDTLFAEVLSALQGFTIACNALSLYMPRNAFLNTLGRYAVPPPVVSAMQTYLETGAGRKDSAISSDGLAAALGGRPVPSLSERNLACLKSTVFTAKFLAGDLDTAWHDVLEVLQNAVFMLGAKRPSVTRRGTTVSASPRIGSSPLRTRDSIDEPRSDVFEGIDNEDISIAINVLFDSTTQMDDKAFTTFLSALCQLSSEMIGSSMSNIGQMEAPETPKPLTFPMSPSPDNRRRTSGITISSSAKSGEKSFSLGKLRIVGMLNLNRLVNRDPEVGWEILTRHLLSITRDGNAPSTVRVQASETLGDILLGSLRAKDDRIQPLVFAVLGKQVDVHPISNLISTDYDVRSAGYHTLNQILESSGHSLQVGWTTIFGMLNAVCHTRSQLDLPNRQSASTRGDANLVRIAFPSLNLICTDFLSSLDHDAMRQCITCLGHFGRQREDVNITLSAIGLMWNVSDAVQADSKDLWLELLLQLLDLGRDPRVEVTSTAMQTLYKCIELYGGTLSTDLWEEVWWKVVFPLLETSKGESQVLALTSTGSIFHRFSDKLTDLKTFDKSFSTLLVQIEQAFDTVDRNSTIASLKALESILQARSGEGVWETFIHMGESLKAEEGYTQESLLALVRISALLHDQVDLTNDRQAQLSEVIRTIMTYSTSPEYRPDVDVMSPLQKAVFDLLSTSSKLSSSLVLSDLATFSLLAYGNIGPVQKGRPSHVAVSKACMPAINKLLRRGKAQQLDQLSDETTVGVLRAYETPIRLRYGCPPSCRFHDDPPLWRTAMHEVVGVLRFAVDKINSSAGEVSPIWSSLMDIFEAWILADIKPQTTDDESLVISHLDMFKDIVITPFLSHSKMSESLVERYSDILLQASTLYTYETPVPVGGTTGGIIPVPSEVLAYWSFDLLVDSVSRSGGTNGSFTTLTLSTLLRRCEGVLRRYIDDVRLRGLVPLPRVRQEELLYVLKTLATLRVPSTQDGGSNDKANNTPSSSHLVGFYPLLLEVSFMEHSAPSSWIYPSEHHRIFSEVAQPMGDEVSEVDDESQLVEVTSNDLVKRCLELIGRERSLH